MHELRATINPTTAIIPINFLIISLLCSYKYNCKINQILQYIDLLNEIDQWQNEPIESLPLKLSKYSVDERNFLSEQVFCRQKAKKKLPTFCKHSCLFTRRSFEQSTSEKVAKFKSQLFKGDLLIDLSGGFGVDDFYFSESFKKVISYDIDSNLNDFVRYNFDKLGVKNFERHTKKAEEIDLKSLPQGSTIYVDPDRRDSTGNRQFLPENHQPNIYELLKKVNPETRVLIKLSPMVDIELLKRNIESLSTIWVISHKFENKEILLECNGSSKNKILSVEIGETALLTSNDHQVDSPRIDWGKNYLYLPSPSVIKANLCKELASEHKLSSVNKNNRILFSDNKLERISARIFRVLKTAPYKPKAFGTILKELNIQQADILARDFFDNTAQLKKRHNIKDGGTHFIVFTTNNKKEPLVFICEKT